MCPPFCRQIYGTRKATQEGEQNFATVRSENLVMSWTTEGVKLLVQLGVEQVILKDTKILFGRLQFWNAVQLLHYASLKSLTFDLGYGVGGFRELLGVSTLNTLFRANFLLQSPPICFVVSISRRYSNSGSEKVSKVAHLSVGIVNLHIGKLLTHIDVIQSNSLWGGNSLHLQFNDRMMEMIHWNCDSHLVKRVGWRAWGGFVILFYPIVCCILKKPISYFKS